MIKGLRHAGRIIFVRWLSKNAYIDIIINGDGSLGAQGIGPEFFGRASYGYFIIINGFSVTRLRNPVGKQGNILKQVAD